MNVWIHALASPPPAHTKPDLSNKTLSNPPGGRRRKRKEGGIPEKVKWREGISMEKLGKAVEKWFLRSVNPFLEFFFPPPRCTWIFWILPGNPREKLQCWEILPKPDQPPGGEGKARKDEEPGEVFLFRVLEKATLEREDFTRSSKNRAKTWKNNTATPR